MTTNIMAENALAAAALFSVNPSTQNVQFSAGGASSSSSTAGGASSSSSTATIAGAQLGSNADEDVEKLTKVFTALVVDNSNNFLHRQLLTSAPAGSDMPFVKAPVLDRERDGKYLLDIKKTVANGQKKEKERKESLYKDSAGSSSSSSAATSGDTSAAAAIMAAASAVFIGPDESNKNPRKRLSCPAARISVATTEACLVFNGKPIKNRPNIIKVKKRQTLLKMGGQLGIACSQEELTKYRSLIASQRQSISKDAFSLAAVCDAEDAETARLLKKYKTASESLPFVETANVLSASPGSSLASPEAALKASAAMPAAGSTAVAVAPASTSQSQPQESRQAGHIQRAPGTQPCLAVQLLMAKH